MCWASILPLSYISLPVVVADDIGSHCITLVPVSASESQFRCVPSGLALQRLSYLKILKTTKIIIVYYRENPTTTRSTYIF